jgi:L-arabinose transport system substrate-binding protein
VLPGRLCVLTAAAAAAALAVTACSSGTTTPSPGTSGNTAGAKKLTFALIQLNGQESYFADEAAGARAAAQQLGATVTVLNAGSSSATFLSDLNTVIGQKVSGIITAPPSNQVGPRIVSLAGAAHIPVVAIDNQFSGANGTPVPFVGIDAPAVGTLTGSQLSVLYKHSGWSPASTRYVSVELPGLATCDQRTTAEKAEFLAQNPGFPKASIIVLPYDGTVEKALTGMGPVITAQAGVKHWLIASCNDDGVVGAAKALRNNGVPATSILGVGLGGDLACQQFAPGALDIGFAATNFIDPKLMGATTVRLLFAHVAHGKPLPAVSHPEVKPMTKANYKTVNPAC